MEIFYAIGLKLIIAFGALTALTALFIYLSCRCFPAWKPAGKLMNNANYRKFFKTHCYIWWAFGGFVVIHVTLAILYFFGRF